MKKVIDEEVYSKAWEGFKGNDWKEATSIAKFVQDNYIPYDGVLFHVKLRNYRMNMKI